MLVAALMVVTTFAGTPLRKNAPIVARQMTAERKVTPSRKAMRPVKPLLMGQTSKMRKAIRQAAPRKVSIPDIDSGKGFHAMYYFTPNEDGDDIVSADPSFGGKPVTFTKVDATTISISGLVLDATEEIIAKIDLETGDITIADGQTVFVDEDYGPIVMSNASADGPLHITIDEESEQLFIEELWCLTIGGEGDDAGDVYDGIYRQSVFLATNAKMEWVEDGENIVEEVLILQDPEAPKTAMLFNFGGHESGVFVTMKDNQTFVIDTQLIVDYGGEYGAFYTYGLTEDTDFTPLAGVGTATTLTFDCYWTFYAPASGYWFGLWGPATITLTDGSEFFYPYIADVAAMPADPEIIAVTAYDASDGYGCVLLDVPAVDVNGNDLMESLLSYQLFSDVAGEIQPVTFTPDLYVNLTDVMTVIPYSFNDSYDFKVYQNYKLVFLNFPYDYDRVGVKSIYAGGGETNETEIQWFEIEKPDADGTYTFDFNSMDVPTSGTNINDGDINEALTLTEGVVELTVSPKDEGTSTANRFWASNKGPQLRVYSGTLTFSVPEGAEITEIVFNAGKWNTGNSADSGEFGEYESDEVTWTGSAQTVVVAIAGNSQINSITVALNGGGEVGDEDLVILPEGTETEAWTIDGSFLTECIENFQTTAQFAKVGNTICLQGLALYFPEAWIKGELMEDGTVIFPSGQFFGEDEYGKEYLIGCTDIEDNGSICDIVFLYDAEAQTMTQVTPYIIENDDSKTQIDSFGCWVDVICYAGEPEAMDPITPPADLVTDTYLFKAIYFEDEEDEEEDEAIMSAVAKDYVVQVQVGLSGDDLYIQGLSYELRNAWVKATKNADGKYVVPANQYMGSYSMLWMSFDYFFTAIDSEDHLVDAVLTFDPEAGTISTEQTLAINFGKRSLNPYVLLIGGATAEKLAEIAVTPAAPSIVEFIAGEDTNYPYVALNIPAKSVDGAVLIESKLAYQLYYEKDGEVFLLTLTKDLYIYFEEDMTIIPYTFNDDFDIYRGGERVYLNQDKEELSSWTKIGVKSINLAAGETHETEIVWYVIGAYEDPDAVENVHSIAESVNYFDLTGRRVDANQKGLLIQQVRQQDGSVKNVKILRK